MIAGSFLAFLLLFLGIGLASVFWSRGTSEDYLVANKTVPPWLAGLSAVATNNSGFMFIGMIGLTYQTGLSSVWLMIGWILGDLCASLLAVRKIKLAAESPQIHSFGGLLAHWQGGDHYQVRRLVGLLTLFFLTLYAAAQLKAGSKATSVLLAWDPSTGIIIAACIVLVYSAAGGLRASIWTDAAQSIVMLAGMSLLLIGGVQAAGGLDATMEQLVSIEPGYMAWFPDGSALNVTLFILGWLFGGIAVIGQPHIVIRYISLDSVDSINRMRFYYYGWFTLFYGATILVGLLSRILFTDAGQFDAELALPKMAMGILPEMLVGLVLAALFAATLSTADSLILSCSAAITRDFTRQHGTHHELGKAKLATATILVTAVLIALNGDKSVFALVLDAWGLLGSAFVPLVIIHALGYPVGQRLSLTMILTGVTAFLLWQQWGLGGMIYSVGPGIGAGLLAYTLGRVGSGYRVARQED
jgi:SSS family transporter